jgi:putative FmdB family regulatory protein
MPTYEYRCPEGHEFERFYRKISDSIAELPCPQCGKVATRLLTGGAGLVFKGSGFYLTDYGKNAHRKSGSESGGGAGNSGGEGSGGGSGGSGGGGEKGASDSGSSSSGGSSESKSTGESSSAKSSDAKPAGPSSSTKSPKSDS